MRKPKDLTLTLLFVAAINGIISRTGEDSFAWTSPEDKSQFLDFIQDTDCIMGRTTFDIVGEPYPNTRFHVMTSSQHPTPEGENLRFWTSTDPLFGHLANNLTDQAVVLGGRRLYSHFLSPGSLPSHVRLKIRMTLEPVLLSHTRENGVQLTDFLPQDRRLRDVTIKQINGSGTQLLEASI